MSESTLEIAAGLGLPLGAVTRTFGILAVRGAGKSNLAAVMAEEMYANKLPFVVVDPVSSWWGLRSAANGKGTGLSIPIFGGAHGDVPLKRESGVMVADMVVADRLSCVLDLFEFSEGDKIRFLIDFAERLYRTNHEHLHLFLEEADDYIPQRPFREQARLLRAWENIVRRGRAKGLGITLITQRSAAINKNVLTQVETLFVLRTTSPQDRKAIAAWVEYHAQDKELLESLPGLKDGEAWVWSPWLKKCERVKVKRRWTFDSGATPDFQKSTRAPTTLADVDLEAVNKRMAAVIEEAKASDPRELRKQVADLRAELAKLKAARPAGRIKRVEVPVFTEAPVKRLEKLAERLEAELEADVRRLDEISLKTRGAVDGLLSVIQKARAAPGPPATMKVPPFVSPARVRKLEDDAASGNGHGGLGKAGIAILNAIGSRHPCSRPAAAIRSGYSVTSRHFANALGELRSKGFVEGPSDGMVLTQAAPAWNPAAALSGDRLLEFWAAKAGKAAGAILRLLAANVSGCSKGEIADLTGYSVTSRHFANSLGFLRSHALVEGKDVVRTTGEFAEALGER